MAALFGIHKGRGGSNTELPLYGHSGPPAPSETLTIVVTTPGQESYSLGEPPPSCFIDLTTLPPSAEPSDAARVQQSATDIQAEYWSRQLTHLNTIIQTDFIDATRAFYKIQLAELATSEEQAKKWLVEAEADLKKALKLIEQSTDWPAATRQTWIQEAKSYEGLLKQVAQRRRILLIPPPPSTPGAAAQENIKHKNVSAGNRHPAEGSDNSSDRRAAPPAADAVIVTDASAGKGQDLKAQNPSVLLPVNQPLPEKSPRNFRITYIVVGIIVLLGVCLVTRGAIYGSRLWRKI